MAFRDTNDRYSPGYFSQPKSADEAKQNPLSKLDGEPRDWMQFWKEIQASPQQLRNEPKEMSSRLDRMMFHCMVLEENPKYCSTNYIRLAILKLLLKLGAQPSFDLIRYYRQDNNKKFSKFNMEVMTALTEAGHPFSESPEAWYTMLFRTDERHPSGWMVWRCDEDEDLVQVKIERALKFFDLYLRNTTPQNRELFKDLQSTVLMQRGDKYIPLNMFALFSERYKEELQRLLILMQSDSEFSPPLLCLIRGFLVRDDIFPYTAPVQQLQLADKQTQDEIEKDLAVVLAAAGVSSGSSEKANTRLTLYHFFEEVGKNASQRPVSGENAASSAASTQQRPALGMNAASSA